MGTEREIRVDNETHRLHFCGQFFPCDRDIEAALPWKEYALLLSSDTDCLSLWDQDGLVRLTRVGVYPQDMVVHDDLAIVCGGADGCIHLFSLPDLHLLAEHPIPGMPERLCLHGECIFILTLLTEPEVHTALLRLQLVSGQWKLLREFAGIPEAIASDKSSLWIAVSDGVTRMLWEEIGT